MKRTNVQENCESSGSVLVENVFLQIETHTKKKMRKERELESQSKRDERKREERKRNRDRDEQTDRQAENRVREGKSCRMKKTEIQREMRRVLEIEREVDEEG